jgi:hypothetical protein
MAGNSGADADTRIIARRQKKWRFLKGARVAVRDGWEFRCGCNTRFIARRQKKWPYLNGARVAVRAGWQMTCGCDTRSAVKKNGSI